MLFVILAAIMISSRDKEKKYRPNQTFDEYQQEYLSNDISDETEYIYDKNQTDAFDDMTILIKNNFRPTSFINDGECEELLISFLTQNLPKNIITRGHTEEGDRLDIVIDGTYALELVIADSEEKLLYLMDLSLKSKKDFDKTAVVIVDVKKIPSSKIQEFATQIERIGIRTIVVEASY